MSFPSPRGLPNPGIEPTSPALAGILFTTEPPGKLPNTIGTTRDLRHDSMMGEKEKLLRRTLLGVTRGKEGGLDLVLMVEEEAID